MNASVIIFPHCYVTALKSEHFVGHLLITTVVRFEWQPLCQEKKKKKKTLRKSLKSEYLIIKGWMPF